MVGEQYIKSPDELIDREVRVHWHWSKKKYSVSVRASNGRCYVVRDRDTGQQICFGKLVLSDAKFVVSPAGAKRAYETGLRNVHASVIGTVKKANVRRLVAVVPCGTAVRYSHNLYPEPEFKALPVGYIQHFQGKHIEEWPGIEWAEFLAVGTDPVKYRPMMLAAGMMRYTRAF